MSFRSLQFEPGLNSQFTPTLDRSGWVGALSANYGGLPATNLIRWPASAKGEPETIGGWVNFLQPVATLTGICRGLHAWATLSDLPTLGAGTSSFLYVCQGGIAYDVTPVFYTSSHTSGHPTDNAITTVMGSASVTIADSNYAPNVGDSVVVSGATAVGGLTISGSYVVQTTGVNLYTITASGTASSSATGGGTAITLKYLLPTGRVDSSLALGWGIGTWGTGSWGVTRPQASPTLQPSIWFIDNWGEEMVAVRSGSTVYDWQPSGGTSTRAAPIINAPPAANGVLVSPSYQQLVAWGTNVPNPLLSTWGSYQDPMMVCWTDFANYNTWFASASNAAGSFRLTQGSIILQAMRAQSQILILTDTSLVSMQFLGLPLVYGFQELGNTCGGVSPKCGAVVGQQAFWWGAQEFYAYNGAVTPIPCPVRDLVFNNVNAAQVYKVTCSINSEFSEVMWEFPSLNATENDSYVSYNYLNQTWAFGTNVTGFPLVGRTCRIDQGIFGFPIATDALGNIWYQENGNNAGGAPLPWSLQSGFIDIAEGEAMVMLDWIVPDQVMQGLGPTVTYTFYGQNYPSDTTNGLTTTKGPYTVAPSTNFIPLRLRSRQIAIQIANGNSVASLFWRLGRIRARVAADGRR